MYKLLIITDSLGAPRTTRNTQLEKGVLWEQTWPTLLRSTYIVNQITIGGATIDDLVNQMHYHKSFNPDVVVIQSGIVDCAPRALSKRERDFFQSLPFGNRILNFILGHFGKKIRNIRQKTMIPKSTYQLKMQEINDVFGNENVFYIGITPPNAQYETQVPGITKQINHYNHWLKTTFKEQFISLDELPTNGLQSDYHHLSVAGHTFVFNLIKNSLEKHRRIV